MVSQTIRASRQRIEACDGTTLSQRLMGHLARPTLVRATLIVYRWNDFDIQTRTTDTGSQNSLIPSLLRARNRGVEVQFVTRDPETEGPSSGLRGRAARRWYKNLNELALAEVDVQIHKTLHAKVYLLELEDDNYFFAVGSSNMTQQGMFRWAECNIVGKDPVDFEQVRRQANNILHGDHRKIDPLGEWAASMIKERKFYYFSEKYENQ